MVAFFCSTPYQILLAVNIKSTILKSGRADIYILNHFKDADNLMKRLKSVGIFNKVETVNCIDFNSSFSRSKIVRLIQKIKIYIAYKKTVERYFKFGNASYDAIYLTYPDVIIQLAIKELSDRNPKIKIHMYEDGTGGYSSEILATSIYKKLFNKLTGFGKTIDKYDSIMVFIPELYSGSTDSHKVKIPSINKNDLVLKNKINEVFGYCVEEMINEKIIFFEQPMNNVLGLNDKIKEIAAEILIADYIVKLHPRSETEKFIGFNVYQNKGTPWEILSLNGDIEEKVLISLCSTASISNKIIFDKEPIIIFLYDMEELKELYQIGEKTKEFIEKFKTTYRDPSRILIAKNVTEIQEYLSKILQLKVKDAN